MEKKIYKVGGCVRDKLLGIESKDIDYVLVGYSEQDLINMGGKKVGADFPVFLLKSLEKNMKDNTELHEHALARIERIDNTKGKGYQGFSCQTNNVMLSEDLKRRDLTINAIAETFDGEIIDYYNGKIDLENKILRHIYSDNNPNNEAFSEDPLRILRVARFASRYEDFTIAEETVELMKKMVKRGDINYLTKERIWKELEKVFFENKPSIFFNVLDEIGALSILFPELYNLKGKEQSPIHHFEGDAFVHSLMVLDSAALILKDKKEGIKNEKDINLKNKLKKNYIATMFGALMHDIGKGFVSKELYSKKKYHNHDSLDLKIELTDELKELFYINENITKTNLNSIINLVKKRLGNNSNFSIEIAKLAINTHQRIHNFFEIRANKKVQFFDNYFPNKDNLNKLEIIADIAKADNLGRYYLVENVTYKQNLIKENYLFENKKYNLVQSNINQYPQKDFLLYLFDNLSKTNTKTFGIETENVDFNKIKTKLYNCKVSLVKRLSNDFFENNDILKQDYSNKSKDIIKQNKI